jgi:hypothetical protein
MSGFTGTVSLLAKGTEDAGYTQITDDGTYVNILAVSNSPNLHLNGNTILTAHTVQADRAVTIASTKSLDFGTTNSGIGGTITFGASTSSIKIGHVTQATTNLPTFIGGGFVQITADITIPQTGSLAALNSINLAKIQIPSAKTLTVTG